MSRRRNPEVEKRRFQDGVGYAHGIGRGLDGIDWGGVAGAMTPDEVTIWSRELQHLVGVFKQADSKLRAASRNG